MLERNIVERLVRGLIHVVGSHVHALIREEEGEAVRADPLDPFLPKELARESLAEGYLSLLPGIDKTDGFFLARFKKEAAE